METVILVETRLGGVDLAIHLAIVVQSQERQQK
jgi:hypothetical protein